MPSARDVNVGSPFVTITTDRDGRRVGHFDMKKALSAGDTHARAVCDSRAFLRQHMTPQARDRFRAAFEECGER